MSTKFLRKTTRRLIRDFDQFQDVYPRLIRSSDPLNNGVNFDIQFNDTNVAIFKNENLSFPAMTPVSKTTQPSSSISATVLLDATMQENSPKTPGAVEGITPFNESLFDLPATQENTGSLEYAPGFSIPARNKIAIPIDITSNREHHLFRLAYADTNADPAGKFYGKASTGFCYYNFVEKRWEDIGLVTNVYAGDIGDASLASSTTLSGQNYFMAQFVGTPNISREFKLPPAVTQDNLDYLGYDKIGSPTEFFDAPRAARYHATSSQGLPLANFIQQPFVLERIDVKIPIVARRKHGAQLGGATDPFEASLRDIDNLVFFLYRQAGNRGDLLNTQRFLVAHESLSFYNSGINKALTYKNHNPIFAHDFKLSISSSIESLFTGSISFSMYPKITSSNFGGASAFSFIDTSASKYKGCRTQNFWTGPINSTISGSVNTASGSISNTDGNAFWRVSNRSEPSVVFDVELNPDQRFLINYSTGSLLPTQPAPPLTSPADVKRYSSTDWSQTNMPYLLLPTDQLIFGLESDINVKMNSNGNYTDGNDTSILSQTSSFFKVLTDAAQVTLFGSLVQNGVAKTHNSINQNLISPAVHEIVANVQDDTDQFDISERFLYVGSYLDNFITGTMALGNRGVAQSIIDGPRLSSGSFIRCLPLQDADKTYFQKGTTTFFGIFTLPYSEARRPKNYFRSNRFGQNRDMLEQARDYKIFNKQLYKKSGGFEEFGPVYAKFVLSSSEDLTQASATFCNNLSAFMTGTFPYIDGQNTSRGPYPATTDNKPFVPKTLIFKT
jgi:hypothetical protein